MNWFSRSSVQDTNFQKPIRKNKRNSSVNKKKLSSFESEDVLLFQDEASIQFAPTIIRTWLLKGQQPEVFTYGGRSRQPLIGAIDPIQGKVHVALASGLKAVRFQHFLEGILARYPRARKLIVVFDNAKAHHSKMLGPFLESNKDRIELMFLPPYSPDLSPME